MVAHAAVTELRVLFDSDNNPATGCTVNGMPGVEQVLVTQVTDDGTTASVTQTHRLICSGGVLGGPVDVNTGGWPVGFNPSSGFMLLETAIPFSAFGTGTAIPSPMRVGFAGTRAGASFSVVSQANGDPLKFPKGPGGRRRAVAHPGPDRVIILDGRDPDWRGISPLAPGSAGGGASDIKLDQAFAYANPDDFTLYFNFNVNTKGSGIQAVNDNYVRTQGEPAFQEPAPGVLGNDISTNGVPLTAVLVGVPETGDVTLNSDGSFLYQPNDPDSLESDSFAYKATHGSDESNVATVTIDVATVNQAPAIITPAQDETVCAGATAFFTAQASGNPAPTVQWSVSTNGGVSFTNIPLATSETLSFTANAGQDGNQYRATFTNGLGSVDTTATLTVNSPPNVTLDPVSQTVCAGSPVTFTAAATDATSVQWQVSTGGPFSNIPGANSTSLNFVTAFSDNGKQYRAVFTNSCGTDTTTAATLTVNPNPTPTITPAPAQVCANSTGNTAAGPAGATTYAWSIVNGTITSATNIQNITYTAGASGTVGLTLVVTNAFGCTNTNTVNVTINPTPTSTITPAPAQVCANSTGNAAAGPAGMATYAWSIVNGTITSATNIQNITYTAGAAGTVDLTLVVTNGFGCSDSDTVNVTINANPAVPTITPAPAQVCASSTGNTAAGPAGATTYAWSIVNGTITSATNIQNITYTAGASGTVDLTLVVTNAAGCSATNTVNVTINANPATPTITPTPAQVCANSTGNTADGPAGATTYAWSIVNGTITSAANIQTITYTAGASGTVGLTLVVTNPSGCSATNTVNVTINANPATPTITPTPAQVCANSTGNSAAGPAGATTYAWSIVNGTITSATNGQNITYDAGASGTVDLTLVVTNASGCSATNTVNVIINANPTTPTITPTPAQVCANSTGNSAAGPAGATTYAWSIVNGSITSAPNIQNITYTAGPSGTVDLTLVVTNAAGCSATNTVNVTINANPATPTITPAPSPVCGGSTGNTAAGPAGATTYAWSIVNGTITSATNIQNITYTAGPSGTADLTLVVTNASGCSASNTVNVPINPSPATPTITPTPAQVCANSTGNSAAGPAGATTYAWSIVNGTITSATNIQNITYTAGASGTVDLTLVVTNAAGCPASNTVSVTINANPGTPTITPNPLQVCANSTGNTADGPAGATTYAWSIVNGTITSATNIQTITYTAGPSGTVDLTLVVTNAAGCSASNTVNVIINANPSTPTITPTPSPVCEASTGNTASGPAGATTYAWSIVNGTITSATNIQNITYTAGTSGTVDLTLVVTNAAGCSATNTVNVTINPSPAIPTITPTPAQVCANSTGNTASGPAGATTYAWSIVNGTITSATNIQNITYTAGASGTVDLTLTVTNAGGCPRSNTVNVTINANPATPTITPTPAQVCANSTGNTADGPAGATTYAWSIVNGSITSATNIQTITYTAGASGTVDLTLVVTNAAGCSASNTVNVTINANPATPTITPTPAQVCASSAGNTAAGPAGATTYAWSIVNGTITSATNTQNITYTAGASGTVDLTLVVTNAAGCSASNTVNVTINANPATPTITPSPSPVCGGSTGNTASGPAGATTYAWSIVNGTITSATNIQNITYTAGASGTVDLTLVVTNAASCSASNTVNVPINPSPAPPTITPTPAQVCANSTGNSAAGPAGATTYAWSIVNGTITSATNIQNITYTAGASGTVDLTLVVTNAAGCSASNTVNVTINANPASPAITPSPATLCPSSTGNTAAGPAGATTYAWSIVNGTITSATNTQNITYDAGVAGTVDLTLVVTNAAGCSASNTVNVPISNAAPVVTLDPLSQSVQSGSSVTFTSTASGTPAPTVQWEVSTNGGGSWAPLGGETNTSLTFTTSLSQNGNQYRAVFTNICGTATSAAATLTVTCPTINVTRNGGGAFPNGTYNSAYTGQSFTASGPPLVGAYTFAVTGGTFPTNLSLAADGTISGTPTQTGLFNFTVTATHTASGCTGAAAFSIAIAPAANTDSYGAAFNIVDNTQFVVTGGSTTSPGTPFVGNGTLNILTNDASDAAKTATAGTFATSGGGSVTIAADGTFIYTPKANPGAAAVTSDSFTYTVVSNGVTSAAGTVNLTLANRVWYVRNNGGGANGQSQSPFTTLAAAQAASTVGDIIYVYNGDGTTLGHTAGITLKNNQQLIGEGVALVVNTVTLVGAGTKPQITNLTAASDAVTLADGNTVRGLNVTGATRDGISSVVTHAGFTGDTLTVQNNTNVGVNLISMTGTVTITNSTISTVSNQALTINNGTAAVTVDSTNTVNGGTGFSVSVINRPAAAGAIAIGATIPAGRIQLLTNLSGTISFTGSQTIASTTNTAVTMTTNAGATINFSGTLAITTTTGSGFVASGGGTLNVSGTANITTGAAASGLSLNGMTVGGTGVAFNSVNTTGATTGIALTNVTGTVSVNGGTLTNGTTGVSLQGASTNLSLAGVTITGPTTGITNTTNFGTLTIGATVNVSAATALNLTTGAITGTFANVTSTGGTNGVNLNAVTGTWGATAGALSGASGPTFNVNGGSGGTITWGGTISQANAATAVSIASANSNTINFNGNVTASGTSTGISISGNTGTYSFNGGTNGITGSGGGISITSQTTGPVTFSAGTNINTTNIATASFNVVTSTASITYSGTITQNANGGKLLNIATYGTGTLTMNGTSLSGTVAGINGVISTLSNITGTVVINNLSLTSSNNNFNNTLVAITGVNTGGSMTFNHLTLSATGANHTGKGLTAVGGGTLTITATGGASSIDVGSSALDLNGQILGASAIGTLNSLGVAGANGVLFTNVTGGTLTIGAGAITGNTASAFKISGGTASVSYAGSITQNTAAQRAVDITGTTGGTVTLSGAIGSNGGTGVLITNAGATINISGNMTLVTGAAAAFTATGSGVVNVTGTNNITTTGGAGITWNGVTGTSTETFNNVTSTTGGAVSITSSGATNFTFNDVTSTTGRAVDVNTASGIFIFHLISSNGGTTGILVQSATGSFTVNGTGVVAGSGGTIQASSSSGVRFVSSNNITLKNMNLSGNGTAQTVAGSASTCGGDIVTGNNLSCVANLYLQSDTTVLLNNVSVTGSGQQGINGNAVNGLTITNCTITGNGTEGFENGILLMNTSGTVSITGSTVENNRARQMHIGNGGSTTMTLNTSNTKYDRTGAGTTDTQQGILMQLYGTSTTTINASTLTFAFNEGPGPFYTNAFHINATDDATITAGSGVSNSSFDNFAAAVIVNAGGTTDVNFDVMNNATMTDTNLQTINYTILGGGAGITAKITGTISGNDITNCLPAGSTCHGIDLNTGTNHNGELHLKIDDNDITGTGGGIVQLTDGAAAAGSAKVHLKITRNRINSPGNSNGRAAIELQGGLTAANPNIAFCTDIGGAGLQNVISGIWANTSAQSGIYIRQRFSPVGSWVLPGYGGPGNNAGLQVEAYLNGRNTNTATPFASTATTTTGAFANGAACITP